MTKLQKTLRINICRRQIHNIPAPPCVSKHAGSSTGHSAEEEPRGDIRRLNSTSFLLFLPPFFLLRTRVFGSDSRLLQLLVANDGTPRFPQTTTGRVCKFRGNYGIYVHPRKLRYLRTSPVTTASSYAFQHTCRGVGCNGPGSLSKLTRPGRTNLLVGTHPRGR